MKKVLTILALAIAFASLSLAGPIPCSGSVTALNAVSGCGTVGGLLFNNFNITGSNGIGVPSAQLATNDNVNVAIGVSGNLINMVVTSNPAANWALTSGQQISFNLQYQVSAEPGMLLWFSASMVSAATAPGSNQVIKGVCDIAFNTNGTCNNALIATLSLNDGTPSAAGASLGGRSTIYVNDNVQIAGNATPGAATLTSITNTFTVPEPMSMTLMGAGLLAVGLFGRRLRK